VHKEVSGLGVGLALTPDVALPLMLLSNTCTLVVPPPVPLARIPLAVLKTMARSILTPTFAPLPGFTRIPAEPQLSTDKLLITAILVLG